MNAVTFGFVVVVAIFGMILVFGLLIVFSFMMAGMRKVDESLPAEPEEGSETKEKRRAARKRARTAQEARGVNELPAKKPGQDRPAPEEPERDWVIAAAVAYLILEDEDSHPNAAPWIAQRPFREDLWLTRHIGEQS